MLFGLINTSAPATLPVEIGAVVQHADGRIADILSIGYASYLDELDGRESFYVVGEHPDMPGNTFADYWHIDDIQYVVAGAA